MKKSILQQGKWNPYVVGAGIGILSVLVFLIVDTPLGVSTTVAELGGAVLGLFEGRESVKAIDYWAKYPPAINYGLLFVIAMLVGAFVSAKIAGTFAVEMVPKLWSDRFGPGMGKRALAAFWGGFLLLFGARLAGGCTSGHGISGTLQLAVSGWVFFAVVMLSGIITARILFSSGSKTRNPQQS